MKARKRLLFGGNQVTLNVSLFGNAIKHVSAFKYLGVRLDKKMNFHAQADYSASKATKAFSKISRLIDGRKALTPATGIMLYKCLLRPHLEFTIPAWACTSDRSIRELEKQGRTQKFSLEGPGREWGPPPQWGGAWGVADNPSPENLLYFSDGNGAFVHTVFKSQN